MTAAELNNACTFTYQSDVNVFIDHAFHKYNWFQSMVDQYAGGFNNKEVLEIGVGINFCHGGFNCVLAALAGAKRVFGIDVIHPCRVCSLPDKKEFWVLASKRLEGLHKLGYRNDSTLQFVSEQWRADLTDNRVNFLQMDAANMYFRDEMFDIIFSNAVFEHIQDPLGALKECSRVLKPGGISIMFWTPFTSFMLGGHDLGICYHYPWAHLRLAKKEHLQKLKEVYSDKDIYSTMPLAHRPNDDVAKQWAADPNHLWEGEMADLNKIRTAEFFNAAETNGLKVLSTNYLLQDEHRKYLTEPIRRELSNYTDEELLTDAIEVVLQKS